jgi:hypothetical protein
MNASQRKDRRPRGKNEMTSSIQSSLLKLISSEVVQICHFDDPWALSSRFKSLWDDTAESILKMDPAPPLTAEARSAVTI